MSTFWGTPHGGLLSTFWGTVENKCLPLRGQFSELLGQAADCEAEALDADAGTRVDVLGAEVQAIGVGAIVGGTRPVEAVAAATECD